MKYQLQKGLKKLFSLFSILILVVALLPIQVQAADQNDEWVHDAKVLYKFGPHGKGTFTISWRNSHQSRIDWLDLGWVSYNPDGTVKHTQGLMDIKNKTQISGEGRYISYIDIAELDPSLKTRFTLKTAYNNWGGEFFEDIWYDPANPSAGSDNLRPLNVTAVLKSDKSVTLKWKTPRSGIDRFTVFVNNKEGHELFKREQSPNSQSNTEFEITYPDLQNYLKNGVSFRVAAKYPYHHAWSPTSALSNVLLDTSSTDSGSATKPGKVINVEVEKNGENALMFYFSLPPNNTGGRLFLKKKENGVWVDYTKGGNERKFAKNATKFEVSNLDAGEYYAFIQAENNGVYSDHTISSAITLSGSSSSSGTSVPSMTKVNEVSGNITKLSSADGVFTHKLTLEFNPLSGVKDYIVVEKGNGEIANLINPKTQKVYSTTVTSGTGNFEVLLTAQKLASGITLAVAGVQDGTLLDQEWYTFRDEKAIIVPISAPKNPRTSEITTTSMRLTWDDTPCFANTDKRFEILEGTKVVGETKTASYLMDNLTPAKKYTFSVRLRCDPVVGSTDKVTYSDAVQVAASTLKITTAKFNIEGKVELEKEDGVNSVYRFVVKRTSSASGITDKWSGDSSSWLSPQYGKDGYRDEGTGEVKGANVRCSTTGYCSTNETGYLLCLKPAFSDEYLSSANIRLFKSDKEAIFDKTHIPGRYYVTAVGMNNASQVPDACEFDPAYPMPAVSNEITLDIPLPEDKSAPHLTFSKVTPVDKTANTGFLTDSNLLLHYIVNDDKDLSECTVDYGKGPKTLDCQLGKENESLLKLEDTSPGMKNFKLTVKDGSGKTDTKTLSYQVDLTAPKFTTNASTTFVTSYDNLIVSCDDAGGSGCTSMQYKLGNIEGLCSLEPESGWQDVPTTSLASYVIPSVSESARSLCVRGRDAAGNFNAGEKFELKLDAQTPEVILEPVTAPTLRISEGVIYTSQDIITLHMPEVVRTGVSGLVLCDLSGDLTTITGFDAERCLAPTNNFTVQLTPGDGAKTINLKVKSGAGKEYTKQINIWKDTVKPTFDTTASVLVRDIAKTGSYGQLTVVPATMKDDKASGYMEFALLADGTALHLSTDMLPVNIDGLAILNNRVVVLADTAGAFSEKLWTEGLQLKNIALPSEMAIYTLQQRIYDKAGNTANDLKSTTFEFQQVAERSSAENVTIVSGVVTIPSLVETNTVPVAVQFSSTNVWYTLTKDAVESTKIPFNGSLYFSTGEHKSTFVTFYDANNVQIGERFGPFDVRVAPKGAVLKLASTAVERTSSLTVPLEISSISSAADYVQYKIVRGGVELASGQRNKSEFASSFSVPTITLMPNITNELHITATDSVGNTTDVHKVYIHDNKAPEVKSMSGNISGNYTPTFTFKVEDGAGTALKSVQARLLNITTGQIGDTVSVAIKENGEASTAFNGAVMRPGHDYTLVIQTEDALGNNSGSLQNSFILTRQKSSIDLLDMLQKLIPIDGTVIPTERVKVTLQNTNVHYVSDLIRGKSVVFKDVLEAGYNEKNSKTKQSKLPIGSYHLKMQGISAGISQEQNIPGFIIDPYFADSNADLNGDGYVGLSDEAIFNFGKQQGKYPATDAEAAALAETILTKLRQARNSNITEYMKR